MNLNQPAFDLLYHPGGLTPPAAVPDTTSLLATITPALKAAPNEAQARAFRSSFENRASLVWGPPGTGKTEVVVAIVLGWLQSAAQTGRPVCVGIGSNTWDAIDLVLGKVADALAKMPSQGPALAAPGLLRIRGNHSDPGKEERVQDVLRGSEEAEKLAVEMSSPTARSLVVGGTWLQLSKLASKCSPTKNAAGEGTPLARWFDLLILDEASQVKVTAAAGYYLLIKEAGHLVLAGDDKQLGPIFTFPVQDTQKGLLDSIFSYVKAKAEHVPSVQLVDNYRTNDEIAHWPRKRFYKEYRAVLPDQRLPFALPADRPANWPAQLLWSDQWPRILDPALPVAVVTYPTQPYTLANPFESHAVACITTLCRLCLGEEACAHKTFRELSLAVVTPHRAQVAAIRNLLTSISGLFGGEVPVVDTVNRFQGDQRLMMVASYSVADKDFIASEEEFIMDPRRFNVTLTRAKAKIVFFVSESLVRHLPSDLETAEKAAHLQLFVSEFCHPVGEKFSLPFIENGRHKQMEGCQLRGRRSV